MAEALAFDMYGTLVDPLGIETRLEPHVGPDASRIARSWRETQLRYTALLTVMGRYENFRWVTARALDHALAAAGSELGGEAKRELLAAYDELEAFPDVRPGLERLRAARHELFVFSNGTADMIERVVATAGIGDCFQDHVSVDEVAAYKPSPRVYRHAAERIGRPIGAVRLVSSNPFDVIGAASAGMRTAWVDRATAAFDPLGPRPELTVRELGELTQALERA